MRRRDLLKGGIAALSAQALPRPAFAQAGYPDRPVRAALIWTDVPDLMELSAEVLDAEIARLTSA